MENKLKKDHAILKVLKASEIRYHIGHTNLGPIDIQLRYGEKDYKFLLDSNPLSKEDNDKMKQLFNIV